MSVEPSLGGTGGGSFSCRLRYSLFGDMEVVGGKERISKRAQLGRAHVHIVLGKVLYHNRLA